MRVPLGKTNRISNDTSTDSGGPIQLQQNNLDNNPATTTSISTDIQAVNPSTPMESSLVSKSNSNKVDPSLISSLERFVYIDTFAWGTDAPICPIHISRNNYITNKKVAFHSYDLPNAILEKSTYHLEKLNHYLYMRADIEFNVKVNATPFQQGSLLVVFQPKNASASKFRSEGGEFLASVTSAPHRVLNLEHSNDLSFTVPYANVHDYIDLSSPDDTFGVLKIYVLSSILGDSSPTSADITIRMRFVNLQLDVPCDSSILSQNKYAEIMSTRIFSELGFGVEKMQALKNIFHAQMQEGESEGPVTKISNMVSGAIDKLGWVTRAVTGAASVMGWSKPNDCKTVHQYVPRPAAFMGNTEGVDSGCTLAQIVDNRVDSSSMNPSSIDELSHDFLFKTPNFVNTFRVPKSSFTKNRLLFKWSNSPYHEGTWNPFSEKHDLSLGSFSYASMLYGRWRGTLKWTLTAIKTQYHSARLMAVYFPNRIHTVPEVFDETMTTNQNFIFDLTAKMDDTYSMEKPIVIPFTSNEPWKNTLEPFDSAGFPNSIASCTGSIAIYCLNSLVAPEMVAQEVTFLLQLEGGDDYEVSVPYPMIAPGFSTPEFYSNTSIFVNWANSVYSDLYFSKGQAGLQLAALYKSDAEFAVQDGSSGSKMTLMTLQSAPPLNLPDGSYTFNVVIHTHTSQDGAPLGTLYTAGNQTIDVDVLNQTITHTVVSHPGIFTALKIESGWETSIVFSERTFEAQLDDGTFDPTPTGDFINNGDSHQDITISTAGEYSKSLRPLMKRFSYIGDLAYDFTRTPSEFLSFDSSNIEETQAVGTRIMNLNGTQLPIPESWYNLVSYLYRFYSGGSRTKVFMEPTDTNAVSSLVFDPDLRAVNGITYNREVDFVSSGAITSAMETTIPYYGRLRARVIGQSNVEGYVAKQHISLPTAQGLNVYYEAAADDANFWFLIGPPVCRRRAVQRTPPPNFEKPEVALVLTKLLKRREQLQLKTPRTLKEKFYKQIEKSLFNPPSIPLVEEVSGFAAQFEDDVPIVSPISVTTPLTFSQQLASLIDQPSLMTIEEEEDSVEDN